MELSCLLQCESLQYTIGERKILTTVNFQLHKGELVFLKGRNGAGKSTLLRLLLPTDPLPSSLKWKIPQPKTSYLGHELGLYLSLSLRENLNLFSKFYGLASWSHLEPWVVDFGLERRLDDPIHTYSRGMLQKSAVLRTFLWKADLYLLDEPFTGMDDRSIQIFLELLKTQLSHSCLLIVTHQEELRSIPHRRWELERGVLKDLGLSSLTVSVV